MTGCVAYTSPTLPHNSAFRWLLPRQQHHGRLPTKCGAPHGCLPNTFHSTATMQSRILRQFCAHHYANSFHTASTMPSALQHQLGAHHGSLPKKNLAPVMAAFSTPSKPPPPDNPTLYSDFAATTACFLLCVVYAPCLVPVEFFVYSILHCS